QRRIYVLTLTDDAVAVSFHHYRKIVALKKIFYQISQTAIIFYQQNQVVIHRLKPVTFCKTSDTACWNIYPGACEKLCCITDASEKAPGITALPAEFFLIINHFKYFAAQSLIALFFTQMKIHAGTGANIKLVGTTGFIFPAAQRQCFTTLIKTQAARLFRSPGNLQFVAAHFFPGRQYTQTRLNRELNNRQFLLLFISHDIAAQR